MTPAHPPVPSAAAHRPQRVDATATRPRRALRLALAALLPASLLLLAVPPYARADEDGDSPAVEASDLPAAGETDVVEGEEGEDGTPEADGDGAPAGEADADAPPAAPSEVTVGMYINRLREVNLRDGTYVVDFWMWFRWQNDDLHPAQTFELVNGEIQNRIDSEVIDDLGFHYTSVRLVARIFHIFDVDHFPYDNHTLHIDIEDVESESHLQVYRPDTTYSELDPSVQVAGWDVTLGETTAADHIYNTNYGFLSIGADTHAPFSRFIQKVELRRGTGMPLLKLFWVTFLSVLLGLLALRVHVTDLDARFGLSVGSIFAAMANTYVLGEILPETEAITMAEQMNFLGVGTIFLAVFISIASIRLVYAGREQASRKLDWWAFVGLGVLYIAANLIVVKLHG